MKHPLTPHAAQPDEATPPPHMEVAAAPKNPSSTDYTTKPKAHVYNRPDHLRGPRGLTLGILILSSMIAVVLLYYFFFRT